LVRGDTKVSRVKVPKMAYTRQTFKL